MPATGTVTSPGRQTCSGYLGSESEVSAIRIGAYFVVHRFFYEVSNAVLSPLPLSRQSESRPFTPLWDATSLPVPGKGVSGGASRA
jgi:hypothetical protein